MWLWNIFGCVFSGCKVLLDLVMIVEKCFGVFFYKVFCEFILFVNL